MQKRVVAGLIVIVLAVSLLAGYIFGEPAAQSQQPTGLQSIIINADGSISPSNAPIQQIGNTYTLTDNIYGTIKILKSNTILNGAGHTLSGPYNGSQANVWVVGGGPTQSPNLIAEYIIGIDFGGKNVDGITIQNIDVRNFSIGMYVWTQNNTVTNSKVYDSILGILLSGENNTITYNYIEGNQQGVFMGFNNQGNTSIPPDIVIYHNDFENNNVQLNGCNCKTLNSTETPHHWDDGKEGNYWSDYNGTDSNSDGVGDTAYNIDALNLDRYPLMQPPITLATTLPQPDLTFTLLGVALGAIVLVAATLLLIFFVRRKRLTRR